MRRYCVSQLVSHPNKNPNIIIGQNKFTLATNTGRKFPGWADITLLLYIQHTGRAFSLTSCRLQAVTQRDPFSTFVSFFYAFNKTHGTKTQQQNHNQAFSKTTELLTICTYYGPTPVGRLGCRQTFTSSFTLDSGDHVKSTRVPFSN